MCGPKQQVCWIGGRGMIAYGESKMLGLIGSMHVFIPF